MPYLQKGNCVHKKKADGSAGEIVRCHKSAAQAKAHLRGLYKAMPEHAILTEFSLDLMAAELAELVAAVPEPGQATAPIRLYFAEGERTPDGRCIDPNAINFDRPPPYSIRLQTRQPESGGHAGAEVCGVINRIARDGLTIVADGLLDLSLEAGISAYNLITNRTMQTWSPDLGDAVIDTEENYDDEDANLMSDQAQVHHFVKASFLGATLVAMPALASAVVELLNDDGSVLIPAPQRTGPTEEPVGVTHEPNIFKYITDRTDHEISEIAACAGPTAPPPEFFEDPNLPELQRFVTITADGRVFGHISAWDECHIGILGRCVTIAEIDRDLSYGAPGYVVCADGSQVLGTRPLPIKGGHATKGLPYMMAMSHYDDPASGIADYLCGWDDHGMWFSGALRPDVTEEQLRILRASGVSLDARERDGALRYLGMCSVNTPAFEKAKARVRIAASAETDEFRVLELVGGNPVSIDEDCGCPD